MDEQNTLNDFITANLPLLYKFMARYQVDEEHLSILIIRFVRAAERYLTEEQLQRYEFSTIAWLNLRSELYEIYRKSRSRAPPVMLEDLTNLDDESCRIDLNELDELLERTLTECQLRALKLRLSGYSNAEIANRDNVSRRAIERRFERIRQKVDELMKELK